ncbi:hypothetical protein HY250_02220 [Candidatus Azambacteria bacterium]|nr:hypothetical protein [Candidatus Azambacteria bacterium]MBI3685198.1 hypothetical protein [Candidatus Azambacteria bacterium]
MKYIVPKNAALCNAGGMILWKYRIYVFMNYKIETKEIILKEPRGSGGTETFVYEPATVDEEPFGSLYIIGWLQNRKAQLEFLPNLVASIIRREFYKPGEENAEACFEIALKKANAALEDIGKTNKNVAQDINLCVINIAENKVRFCTIGDIITWLWRAGRLIDMSAKKAHANKKELFSTIIAGGIVPSDKFIFSTGRVMDLFSEKGIQKLCALNLAQQAEIITKIYQKNNGRIPLPDQAAILLEVKHARSISQWIPFATMPRINNASTEIQPIKEKSMVMIRMKKLFLLVAKQFTSKRGLLSIAMSFLAVTVLWNAAAIGTRFYSLRQLSAKLTRVDALAGENKQEAASLLREIQSETLRIMPSWYLASSAEKLFKEADERLAHLYSIHKEIPLLLTDMRTNLNAMKFLPAYIFDGGDFVYVFGESPDTYAKVKKQSGDISFTFLRLSESFKIERMLAKDGDFYFINNEQKAAYVLFPKENELVKVAKTLKKILNTASAQNTRETQEAAYTLQKGSQIIKRSIHGNTETVFLGTIPPVIDFEISQDKKEILLLTKERIYVFPHQ